MTAEHRTFVRARELLAAEFGDELVALDVEDGLCFAFNEVATLIWQRLASPTSEEDLVDGLVEEYDVSRDDCSADVRQMLDLLEQHRLIRAI